MNQFILSAIYLSAIILANLVSAWFGPSASIINAFVLIGLVLSTRDRLHDLWGGNVKRNMLALIVLGGTVSYLLNRDAGPIALASMTAFAVSETLDALLYAALKRFPFLARSNVSNLLGAASDSLIFPTIAFGALLWPIVLGQFAAKVLGGFLWSLVLNARAKRTALTA